jgi:hypothetical protein
MYSIFKIILFQVILSQTGSKFQKSYMTAALRNKVNFGIFDFYKHFGKIVAKLVGKFLLQKARAQLKKIGGEKRK